MTTTSINLKPDKVKQLRQIRKTHKSSIIRDRVHVIILKSKKKTIKEIAEVLERSENFVKNAIALYKQGGISDLLNLQKGGNNRKLTAKETESIKSDLEKSPIGLLYKLLYVKKLYNFC